jgi:Tol biopolymer transport system component
MSSRYRHPPGEAGERSKNMYETSAEKKWTVRRRAAILAAVIFALGGLLALSASPARASFPAANGKIVFQSERTVGPGVHNPEGDYEIFSVKPDGSGLVQLTDNNQPDLEPSYSAYGNRIAFVRNSDIWVMRSDGMDQIRLTYNITQQSGYAHDPAFSPDGTRIAFSRIINGTNAEIYVMNSDGSNKTKLTATNSAYEVAPSFSPDGRKLLFVGNMDGDSEIYVMDIDGSNLRQLTDNDYSEGDPAWSPDGARIAFDSDRSGNMVIWTIKADGSHPTNATNNPNLDFEPAWSPGDDQRLAFTRYHLNGQGYGVYMMNPDGSNQTVLTNVLGGDFAPHWGFRACTITGTNGDDMIVGSAGNDIICALEGKDMIRSREGDDTIFGDGGTDTLIGGKGRDAHFGGLAPDRLDGRDGGPNDSLHGQVGLDSCFQDQGDAIVSCP